MKKRIIAYLTAGVLCASLIGGVAYAEESAARRQDIKSEGVLYIQSDMEYVHLDAADLLHLADEVDLLETNYKNAVNAAYFQGYGDGKADAQLNGAQIEYIKHEHEGNSDEYGGCYTVGYHSHNKTDTCTKKTVWSPNGHRAWTTIYAPDENIGNIHAHSICDYCGKHCIVNDLGNGNWQIGCQDYNLIEKQVYDCGEPINTWNLGCGKTTDTIVGAVIVWDD